MDKEICTRNIETREGYEIWDRFCAIPYYGFIHSADNSRIIKAQGIGNWIDRDEAMRVVDWAQEDINELRHRLRAAESELEALRPKPKYLAKDDPARKCHSDICWACEGTGIFQRPDMKGICDMNDKIPF